MIFDIWYLYDMMYVLLYCRQEIDIVSVDNGQELGGVGVEPRQGVARLLIIIVSNVVIIIIIFLVLR